jgi:hypothetical protein
MTMKWITRKNVKVDRVACPWLIRRFVDKDAEFIFVEEDKLLSLAESMKAIPYDAPRIPEIKLNHRVSSAKTSSDRLEGINARVQLHVDA